MRHLLAVRSADLLLGARDAAPACGSTLPCPFAIRAFVAQVDAACTNAQWR